MQLFFGIGYFVIGAVQLFAVADGIGKLLHFNNFFSFFFAFMVTYIPLLGSALGVYGATTVWDWDIWQAVALFFWYIPVALLLTLIGTIFDR
ncbi:hypothetical protein [Mariluticola halotolerans]|uniref:hypothetical protein n=1 Tax=Mariluticola halotolerans TaxID=2909283 RepID=UPI0026E3511F|nr:hypothetical protein [Mariluticola halotolerans]UJQ95084.1 hypothetical protein L1P08_03620 [Mariluticola halotolerans]